MKSAAALSALPGLALVARLHVDLCRCASATCRP
ncbi:putative leader peptide [Streptomyces sp. NPDC006610]